jgi:hypothetical protein
MKILKALFFVIVLVVAGFSSMYFIENTRSSSTTSTLVKRGYPEEAMNTVNELKEVTGEAAYIYKHYEESSEKWKSQLDLWMVKSKDTTERAKILSPPPEYAEVDSSLSLAIFSIEQAMGIFPDVIKGKPGSVALGTFIKQASDSLDTTSNKLKLQQIKGH